jgi:hypothetical protein
VTWRESAITWNPQRLYTVIWNFVQIWQYHCCFICFWYRSAYVIRRHEPPIHYALHLSLHLTDTAARLLATKMHAKSWWAGSSIFYSFWFGPLLLAEFLEDREFAGKRNAMFEAWWARLTLFFFLEFNFFNVYCKPIYLPFLFFLFYLSQLQKNFDKRDNL